MLLRKQLREKKNREQKWRVYQGTLCIKLNRKEQNHSSVTSNTAQQTGATRYIRKRSTALKRNSKAWRRQSSSGDDGICQGINADCSVHLAR